jgi:hypothetical protein
LSSFGIFFPALVYCTKKNLATLSPSGSKQMTAHPITLNEALCKVFLHYMAKGISALVMPFRQGCQIFWCKVPKWENKYPITTTFDFLV